MIGLDLPVSYNSIEYSLNGICLHIIHKSVTEAGGDLIFKHFE